MLSINTARVIVGCIALGIGLCFMALLVRGCVTPQLVPVGEAERARDSLVVRNAVDEGLKLGLARQDSLLVERIKERQANITYIENRLEAPVPPKFVSGDTEVYRYLKNFAAEWGGVSR